MFLSKCGDDLLLGNGGRRGQPSSFEKAVERDRARTKEILK